MNPSMKQQQQKRRKERPPVMASMDEDTEHSAHWPAGPMQPAVKAPPGGLAGLSTDRCVADRWPRYCCRRRRCCHHS